MNLTQLKDLYARAGVRKLYAKRLAENDNSKNQVYLGPGFQALNLLPNNGIVPDSSPKNPIFKAALRFAWMLPDGQLSDALGAQLILYPQYPEVRFSGFLKGCSHPPAQLMASRIPDRILFLGVTPTSQIIGFVVAPESTIAGEYGVLGLVPSVGVFAELSVPTVPDAAIARERLLTELRRIHHLGWIDSKQLDSSGRLRPCRASQCGGFTLEAELGIPKNSAAEPDFLGWEVKQHTVSNFDRPESAGPITLMTPEPTGGFYKTAGVRDFVFRFGYEDKLGRKDRLNFGGIHRVGVRQLSTGLTMRLEGYDVQNDRITDADGSIVLANDGGEVAASWAFASLLAHWARKHSRAVYVPSMRRLEPSRQYSYGPRVRLAERTDPLRLLAALAKGSVYYDPGIKLENASADARVKRRSQFRIASKQLASLYEAMESVEV